MSSILDVVKEYGNKTEIHAHTSPVSRCSQISPEDMVRNYLSVGCNAVAITNHLDPNWIEGDPQELAEKYLSDYYATREWGEKLGLSVILGVEIRFTENHNDYLVYGVEPSDIERMIGYLDKGIVKFYREFKTERNLILQAHPFRKNMELAPLDSIDGIESFNCHPGHNSAIGVAARYARDNKLIVSGGTDYHHEGHHGICVMRTKQAIKDSFDLADALRSRDYLFDISGSVVYPYAY
ncbi:MAG: PHP domain-containing protein [Clostridia bacterium]|nr:PHP domain-containing protein [Clostridia bacterium]